MTVTPVLMQDLGIKTTALGSAGLLMNTTPNHYAFGTGLYTTIPTESLELSPTPNTISATTILNVHGSSYSYRSWQMPNLYNTPAL